MKTKKGIKFLSVLACISMLVTQIPTLGNATDEAIKTEIIHDKFELPTITKAPYKSPNQTVEQYEKLLYESELPTIKGDEFGIPIVNDPVYYNGTDMNLTTMFTSSAVKNGYLVDRNNLYAGTNVKLSDVLVIRESSYNNKIDIDFKLSPDPRNNGFESRKLWDKLIEEGQLKTHIQSTISPLNENIFEENIPTMTFGSLVAKGEAGWSSPTRIYAFGDTTNDLILNFKADDQEGDEFVYGYAGENRTFQVPIVKIVDDTVPYIESTSLNGHYLTLNFNEPLRLSSSDDSLEDLNGYGSYVGTDEGDELSTTILGFKNDNTSVVLYIDVQRHYELNEDYIITNFGFRGNLAKPLDLFGFDKETGETIIVPSQGKSPICDYAGNTFEQLALNESVKVIASSPKSISFTINGDMLVAKTDEKDTDSNKDGFDEGVSRNNLFASAGQTLNFAIEVDTAGGNQCLLFERDDYSKVTPANQLYLTLNIKDKNGAPVKLALKSTINGVKEDYKTADGTTENPNAITGILQFEPLTFEEGMYIDGGDYIKPISLNGSDIVIDQNGNPIAHQVLGGIGISKQIFVDTQAPVVSDATYKTIEDGMPTDKGIQVIATITENEKGSGIDYKNATLSIVGESYVGTEKKPTPIEYTYDENTFSTKISDSPDTFGYLSQNMDNATSNTITVPITFTDTKELTLQNLKVVVTAEDWAGNIKTTEHAIANFFIDKNAPVVKEISSNLSYTNDNTTFTGEFSVNDTDLSDAAATYAWGDGSFASVDINDGKISIQKTFPQNENVTETLNIKVTDKNGNTSETYTKDVSFDTSSAATIYKIESDLAEPALKPIIKVSAPSNRAADNAQAYTRATIDIYGYKYIRIITGDEKDVNIFDFSGKWQEAQVENNVYTKVKDINGADIDKYYTEVTVTLESAFVDLTPEAGASLEHDISTGYTKTDLGTVKFAYDSEGYPYVYKIDNQTVTLNGETVDDKEVVNQTLANYKFDFTLENVRFPEWELSEVDFDNSYIALMYKEDYDVDDADETVFAKVGLNDSFEQSFTAPNKEYKTGVYTVRIYVQGKNGKVLTGSFVGLVVDNEKITNSGIWEYNYSFASNNGYWYQDCEYIKSKSVIATTSPFNFIRMVPTVPNSSLSNVEGHYAVLNNGEKVNITGDNYQNEIGDGAKYRLDKYSNSELFSISICADKKSTNLKSAGNLEKIEFWGYSADGTKTAVYTEYGFGDYFSGTKTGTAITVSDILDTTNLTAVDNAYTINYQLTMQNGNQSSVKSFTVVVPTIDQLPTAELEYSNLKTTTLENGEKRVLSVDIGVKNPSCSYSNVKVYRAYKPYNEATNDYDEYSNFIIEEYTGPVTYTAEKLKANIPYDLGENEWENEAVNRYNSLKEFFFVEDEYGATAVLTPLFDGENAYKFPAGKKDKMLYTFLEEECYLDKDFTISTPSTGSESETLANAQADSNAAYIFNINPENIDVNQSTITTGDKTFNIHNERPGTSGTSFVGSQLVDLANDQKDLFLKFAYPIDQEKANQNMTFDFTLNAIGKYFGNQDYTNANVNSIPYKAELVNKTENGVVYFNTYASVLESLPDYKYTIPTNCDTTLTGIEATDLYGITHIFDATVTAPTKPTVTVDEVNATITPVTLIFKHNSKISIACTTFDTATDDDYIIKNNNTNEVTVIAKNNMKITVSSGGTEIGYYDVLNIDVAKLENEKTKTIVPKAIVSVYPDGFDENDTQITGAITITLVDNETGDQLYDADMNPIEYTFDPEATNYSSTYTFPKNSYYNIVGAVGEDFTVDLLKDLNITLLIKDTTAPSVQITGKISDGASQTITKEIVYNKVSTNTESDHPSLAPNPAGYTEKTSMTSFIAGLGWANKYIFNYDIADKTDTKVFIKDGIINSLPTDYTATNDIISGVTLNKISKNITVNSTAKFTLCIEDINKNITFVPFNVSVSQKDFAVTTKPKLNNTYDAINLYVLAPNDVTDFKVLNDGVIIETAYGEFKDCYFLTFTLDTENVEINYSFKYNGFSFTDSITCSATGLGETDYEISWSANKNETATNKDVIATLSFEQNIESVKFAKINPLINAKINYKQVILTYTGNTPAQTVDVTIKLSNGDTAVLRNIKIPAVTNIDKTVPDITYKKVLSENGKSVKFSLTSDENVYSTNGVYSNSFTYTVKANKIYTYTFTDKAGNIVKKDIPVSEIIDSDLQLQFSTDNLSFVGDPSSLKFDIGESFYIKANRDCSIIFNELPAVNIAKNISKKFVMDYALNESPSIFAQDKYGSYYYQFTSIKPKDMVKPTITVIDPNIYAKTSTSLDDLRKMLLDNVAVIDNIDMPSDITVELEVSAPTSTGLLKVVYKATDLSQNTTTLVTSILIYSENAAIPTVNGTFMERNSNITVDQNDKQTLLANINSGESFSVVVKPGVQTIAQMKIGADTIVYNQTDNSPINLNLTKQGFYTVCIKTRDRDTYRFIVYVK